MLTADVVRNSKGWVQFVNCLPPPEHIARLRIPPAWTEVCVDPNPRATILATGRDAAGRLQRLYSPQHIADAKAGKFERVRALLAEEDDIRTQIEGDINSKDTLPLDRECAHVAYLIFETGMRPGSNADTLAAVQAYGATTLQLRHVKPCIRGVRLKFVGKKGVRQNVLVTNPYLVRLLKARKKADAHWSTPVFSCSASSLNAYLHTLGSGDYSAKDFRTLRGTSLALELLGNRNRLPKSKARRKKVMNAALDKVSRKLGNTRAIAKASYVDPSILERFLN